MSQMTSETSAQKTDRSRQDAPVHLTIDQVKAALDEAEPRRQKRKPGRPPMALLGDIPWSYQGERQGERIAASLVHIAENGDFSLDDCDALGVLQTIYRSKVASISMRLEAASVAVRYERPALAAVAHITAPKADDALLALAALARPQRGQVLAVLRQLFAGQPATSPPVIDQDEEPEAVAAPASRETQAMVSHPAPAPSPAPLPGKDLDL